ncbi:hypothetical protein NQ317_017615, partial [Molorchus minor]
VPERLNEKRDTSEVPTNRLNLYERLQQIVQHFWRRWSAEYLTSIQQRTKWRRRVPELNVGDLVVIRDDNSPPLCWKIGRITTLLPGADGITRVVNVLVKGGEVKLSVNRLYMNVSAAAASEDQSFILDNSKSTGRGRIMWAHFKQMHEIFGNDPENEPLSIASNGLGLIVLSNTAKQSVHQTLNLSWVARDLTDVGRMRSLITPVIPRIFSPWWGGFFERLIGLVKQLLRRVLGRASLNYEELLTVICDCEAVVTSRPLTYVSDDARLRDDFT